MVLNYRDKVFISYSHKDREWLDTIRTHLAPFVQAGAFSIWDDTMIAPGAAWRQELEYQLDSARVAILLVSPDFLASRFIVDDELPPLLDAAEDEGLSILWLPIRPSAFAETEIEDYQALTDPKKPLSSLNAWEVETELVRVAGVIKDKMKSHESLATAARGVRRFRKYQPLSKRPPFVNREKELKTLGNSLNELIPQDGSGDGEQESGSPLKRVVVLYGDGGIGKTSVVEHWLGDLPTARLKDVKVLKWSFYGQDYFDSQERSSDLFFEHALRSLDETPHGTPFDNCEKLLEIAARRPLLIALDGLEVLQYASGFHAHQIRDLALSRLLQRFARLDKGMCVVTTRCKLSGGIDRYVHQDPVDRLKPGDGAELLRQLDVQGSKRERVQVSKAVCGHPLSLTLIATYLHRECDGNIQGWRKVLSKGARVSSDALAVILRKYEKRLLSPEELSLLRLLAILDRPISTEQMYHLAENIVHLAQPLAAKALRRLARSGIIHYSPERSYIDAHPAVRNYFARRLRVKSKGDNWEKIHARLYYFFVDEVDKLPHADRPLIDNASLLDAIRHACSAGMLREAFDLYWMRLVNGPQRSSFHDRPYRAESFPILIDCLSGFLARRWTDVRSASSGQRLADDQTCQLFEEAGHYLFVDGRLDEAKGTLARGIELRERRISRLQGVKDSDDDPSDDLNNDLSDDYYAASRHRRLRAEACLARGELSEAINDVGFSLIASDPLSARHQVGPRAASAYIQYHLGNISNAIQEFSMAEELWTEAWEDKWAGKERQSTQARVLASYWGLWCGEFLLHCADLLAANGRHDGAQLILDEVYERSRLMLWHADNAEWVLDRGHAHSLRGQARGRRGDLPAADEDLDQALAYLRSAGEQHHLVRGLLARNAMLCAAKQAGVEYDDIKEYIGKAVAEIEEAKDFALQHGMELLLADCQIEDIKRGRYLEGLPTNGLHQDFRDAVTNIQKMKYGRFYSTLLRLSLNTSLDPPLVEQLDAAEVMKWQELDKHEQRLAVETRQIEIAPQQFTERWCLIAPSIEENPVNGRVKMVLTRIIPGTNVSRSALT